MAQNPFGFKTGTSGTHQCRTMMFSEVSMLLGALPAGSPHEAYKDLVIRENLLSKPTQVSRELTFEYLKALYLLEPENPLFRNFRRLWELGPDSRPLLALLISLARDPFLRGTVGFILNTKPGDRVTAEDTGVVIEQTLGKKFSDASLKSFSQNVNGTWTQAGFLTGKAKKFRVEVEAGPVAVSFALFLAWLEGARGQQIFGSQWAHLCGSDPEKVERTASGAARQGLFTYRRVGEIMEIGFEDWLTESERGALS